MSRSDFPDEQNDEGEFVRQDSAFRQFVRTGDSRFPPASGRYHLYVSLACPWAHRTIVLRRLLGLEDAIGMTVVDPERDERGWRFGAEPDPVNGFEFLAEAYRATDEDFSARVTVPVLWDRETSRIVNNESAEILRMLNDAFLAFARTPHDFYPEALRGAIDAVNAEVYRDVNNGVYKAGFATTQRAYERNVRALFAKLDDLEARLAASRYLCGDRLTEADVRLFTTLVRFDAVYHGHFKCNVRRIADYEHLGAYLRDLYQTEGVRETVDFDHIKRHYYRTHEAINPTRIVPVGPELDLEAPHGRGERPGLG